MPFLTQGKTNWKYIIIVVISAILVGGGILLWQHWEGFSEEIVRPPTPSKIELTDQDNGKTIEVAENDLVVITLRGIFDEPEFDSSVLKLNSYERLPPLTDKPGDVGSDRWEFQVLKSQESKIEIYSYQPGPGGKRKLDFTVNLLPKIGLGEREIKRITITTDKSVYFPEETIEIIIENSLDKSIWHKKGTGFAFPSKIQKFENSEWKDIIRYNMCHCVACVYQTPYFVELKPGEVLEDKWEKIFKGPRPSCDPPSASPGKYRAYFSYFLNKEGGEEIREYSNEFIIEEETNWIGGGSKTSSILVKPSRTLLNPGEQFLVTVRSWTFNPEAQMKDHPTYIRIYNTKNPDEPVRSKECLVHQEEGDWYARIEPLEWEIEAPQKEGTYTYRIVEKIETWPTFEDYDKKVEFTVKVLKKSDGEAIEESGEETIEDETANWKAVRDSRIISAISQSRVIMSYTYANKGSYQNFNCTHYDMKDICEEIRKNSPEEDGPVIKQSKEEACIYSKLNAKEDYWYCAESGGIVGFIDSSGTKPAPGDSGFCDGQTFTCPPVEGKY